MKKLLLLLTIIYSTSCKGQNSEVSVIRQIDRDGIAQNVSDVFKNFTKKELPLIYRLGGVTCKPYLFNRNIVKIELIFEGDRETLIKSYYFNDESEIFYIHERYAFFSPPKWEEESKEISVKKSGYFLENKKISKSFGENIIDSIAVMNEINKLLEIKRSLNFDINFSHPE